MSKFPVDAPVRKVIKALEQLGFEKIREGNHIAMLRQNPDGTKTFLTSRTGGRNTENMVR